MHAGWHWQQLLRQYKRLQVIAPSVRAYLYTWGGRRTAEGEKIPVRIEDLDIGYIDGMLLLPLVVEHGIDERSPLYGHTYESLRVGAGSSARAVCAASLGLVPVHGIPDA